VRERYHSVLRVPDRLPQLIPANDVKSIGSQLRVLNRMLNLLVTQVILNQPGIVTFGGEVIAAAVPEHVRMDWELKAS